MSKKPVAAIVVIYNRSCADSPTCLGLRALGISVVIYDNSTADFDNKNQCRELGWAYLGGTGNLGLSKAYNACIDHLKAVNHVGLVCLFDDDTQIDVNYFEALQEAANSSNARIFVPIIRSQGRILSPCMVSPKQRVSFFADDAAVYAYQGEELSAINSGMALDIAIFSKYRYNETIFLDGIDHYFVKDMKSRGERIDIMRYCCQHDFSGDGRPTKDAALFRFRIFAKDYAYILKDDKAAFVRLVGKRALHLCLQYRTFTFISEMRRST